MLNKYEKRLITILESNPHITTRKFVELAELGKPTFYKYTKTLEHDGYISYERIKNRKEWYLMKTEKNIILNPTNYDSTVQSFNERFDEIKSKIIRAMEKAKQSGKTNDMITGYGDSVLLILSILGQFKLIYYYRKKHVPDEYPKFEKKLKKLLEQITDEKKFPEHGYGRLSINQVIRETEDRLDEFLEIEKPIPEPI